MRKLTVIKADGSDRVVTYVKKADLRMLQKFVGGLIQPLPHFTMFEGKRCAAYMNEEGLLQNLPVNDTATQLWKNALGWKPETAQKFWYEPIVQGDMVIDQKADASEGLTRVSNKEGEAA